MLDQVNIYTLIVSAITIPNVLFLYVMSPVHFNGAMPLHYMHYYNIIHTLSICLFLSISLSRTLYINLSRSLSIFSSFRLTCLSHSHSFSLIFFFYLFFRLFLPLPNFVYRKFVTAEWRWTRHRPYELRSSSLLFARQTLFHSAKSIETFNLANIFTVFFIYLFSYIVLRENGVWLECLRSQYILVGGYRRPITH